MEDWSSSSCLWLLCKTFTVWTKWKMREIKAFLLLEQWMWPFNVTLSQIMKTTKQTSSIRLIHPYNSMKRMPTFQLLKLIFSHWIVSKMSKYSVIFNIHKIINILERSMVYRLMILPKWSSPHRTCRYKLDFKRLSCRIIRCFFAHTLGLRGYKFCPFSCPPIAFMWCELLVWHNQAGAMNNTEGFVLLLSHTCIETRAEIKMAKIYITNNIGNIRTMYHYRNKEMGIYVNE